MLATISVVLYMRAPFKVLFMKGAVLYWGPTAGQTAHLVYHKGLLQWFRV